MDEDLYSNDSAQRSIGGGNRMYSIFDIMKMFGQGGNGSFNYTPWGSGAGEATGLGYFGANAPAFGAIANGISQLGSVYMGIKQLGLAKDQLRLNKRAYETNLRNQTQAYNTQIGDRIAGRSYATEEERQAALRAAQLPVGG